MSILDLMEAKRLHHEQVMRWVNTPLAWVLAANPVWGRMETVNRIALFDTEEMLLAYEKACRLPEPVRTPDGIVRTYRSDTLLYDYNPGPNDEPMHAPAMPFADWEGVAWNPAPPVGAAPECMPELSHPRVGVDYDVGFGGPRSDMDGVLPVDPLDRR